MKLTNFVGSGTTMAEVFWCHFGQIWQFFNYTWRSITMGLFTSHAEDLAQKIADAHDQGQTDASNHERHLPYTAIQQIFAVDTPNSEIDAINNAYEAGQANHESQTKGVCFLTTACVNYAGLADDCHELTVLRKFRDDYVANRANGADHLTEYYRVAPEIVHRIDQDPERDLVLAGIFSQVTEAVKLIESDDFEAAFQCYRKMFKGLGQRYCAETQ